MRSRYVFRMVAPVKIFKGVVLAAALALAFFGGKK